MVRKDDFHPNLRRKVEALDLPKQVSGRLKSEEQALKFEKLRKVNQKETGNNGDQKTLEFILDLAWQKYEELEDVQADIEKATK